MGANSEISWTHHTFNPWWGCEKVSPACAHCYAETWAKRTGHDSLWKGERRFFGDKHWNEPLKWNREAGAAGERRRVFCASMADVFEDRADLVPHRARLFDIIRRTPNLDWLLLTKRPENIRPSIESVRTWCVTGNHDPHELHSFVHEWLWRADREPPANVWLGTTVENQEMAEKRIPALLSVPARVRFLSCEPLLGPVDLGSKTYKTHGQTGYTGAVTSWDGCGVDWVICGGESGANARPMNVEWARSLRDQCAEADVAFHFKQWGDVVFREVVGAGQPLGASKTLRIGKKAAGRLLDGVLHDAFPR